MRSYACSLMGSRVTGRPCCSIISLANTASETNQQPEKEDRHPAQDQFDALFYDKGGQNEEARQTGEQQRHVGHQPRLFRVDEQPFQHRHEHGEQQDAQQGERQANLKRSFRPGHCLFPPFGSSSTVYTPPRHGGFNDARRLLICNSSSTAVHVMVGNHILDTDGEWAS